MAFTGASGHSAFRNVLADSSRYFIPWEIRLLVLYCSRIRSILIIPVNNEETWLPLKLICIQQMGKRNEVSH